MALGYVSLKLNAQHRCVYVCVHVLCTLVAYTLFKVLQALFKKDFSFGLSAATLTVVRVISVDGIIYCTS